MALRSFSFNAGPAACHCRCWSYCSAISWTIRGADYRLPEIARRTEHQANLVYAAIEDSEIYENHVHPQNRLLMNIPFQLARQECQDSFLRGCDQRGLAGPKGHKSVGGLRASLYNAVTNEAVDALPEYPHEFARNPSS